MAHKSRLVFVSLAMALVSAALYILFHESGHAAVAILCGADNVKISILSAHTWWTGGSFTILTESLVNAAGAALPVCICWTAMLFYSENCENVIYHLAYFFFFISAVSSILAWVGIPLYAMFAPFPDQTDDVVKFLNVSGVSPAVVSLAGIFVILFSIFIAVKKRLFHTLIQIKKKVTENITNSDAEAVISKKSLMGTCAAVFIAACIAVLLELPGTMQKPVISFTITNEAPETGTYETESFDIQKEHIYAFQTQLDAEGLVVVVRILNEKEELCFQNCIYDRMDSISTLNLSPGAYTISITYLTDADTFTSFFSAMDDDFENWEMENFAAVWEHEAQLSRLFVELK